MLCVAGYNLDFDSGVCGRRRRLLAQVGLRLDGDDAFYAGGVEREVGAVARADLDDRARKAVEQLAPACEVLGGDIALKDVVIETREGPPRSHCGSRPRARRSAARMRCPARRAARTPG